MSTSSQALWQQLSEAGLVQGPAPEREPLESPWYVKTLLGFSGWLAAVFLLGFIAVGLQFVLKSSAASLVSGGLLLAAAFYLLRIPKNEFIEHLGLAISLTGQSLLIWALFRQIETQEILAWLLITLLHGILAVIMPNFVHRILSTLFAAFSLSVFLTLSGMPFLSNALLLMLAAWIWLREFHSSHNMASMRAMGYGLVLALIPLEGTLLFPGNFLGLGLFRSTPTPWVQPWMAEVLLGLVALYTVWQLLSRQQHTILSRTGVLSLLGTLLICLLSLEAQGIIVGLIILLLGFSGSNRLLLGLGTISLLLYISAYYYLLDTTLLTKAGILLLLGLGFLTIRWLLPIVLPANRSAGHAG